MGTMSFLLPTGLPAEAAQAMERACVAGGPDSMPWPTRVVVNPDRINLARETEDSGCLVIPWPVAGMGRFICSSSTLIERSRPYHLQIELARGKINQLRCQAEDWKSGGMHIPPSLQLRIRDVSVLFGRSLTCDSHDEAGKLAQEALLEAHRLCENMVLLYIDQMFQARHQRQPRLDTILSCRLGTASELHHEQADAMLQAFNSFCLPFNWREIEPQATAYDWEAYDALLSWASKQGPGLTITAGPLIDFSPYQLPDWVQERSRDVAALAGVMCGYVEAAIKRYRGRIRTWQLTAASNAATFLSLGEDELLWLTARLVETARQIDSNLALSIGIAQPWGDYMVKQPRSYSPFIFADTLLRSGLNLSSLDLELACGMTPRGSYCRDLLEASRVIDLYSLLGMPLRVTLAYPSSSQPDPLAEPDIQVRAGQWHGGFTPEEQNIWAKYYASLALCKPTVRSVQWAHLSDAALHQFPNCGLFDSSNQAKPALNTLQSMRENHLR